MSKNQPRRGRPPKYTGKLAVHIVSLIAAHGATGAMDVLNAPKRNKAARARNHKLVPAKGLGISMPTLLKLAKDAKVTLKRGRPSIAA